MEFIQITSTVPNRLSALFVEFAQVLGGGFVSLSGGLVEETASGGNVFRHAATKGEHHTEVGLRFGVAERCGFGEPLRGCLVITRRATSIVSTFLHVVESFRGSYQRLLQRLFGMFPLNSGGEGRGLLYSRFGLSNGGLDSHP